MTQYAAHDASGYVLGFLDADDAPASSNGRGHCAVASPVSGWPTPPCASARLKINTGTGVLTWEDPRTEAQAWADARAQRDALLAASDWTVTRAVEMSAQIPTAWSEYRQDLRDITKQADPFNITWPTPPSE